MWLPFQRAVDARRARLALPPAVRDSLRLLRIRARQRAAEDRWTDSGILSLSRLVALDLETTGPNMHADRIISIGAVVTGRTVRHDDAFERVVRQERESASDNILIHQIGGQEQRAGADPVGALVAFLEYLDGAVAVAYRAVRVVDATSGGPLCEGSIRREVRRRERAAPIPSPGFESRATYSLGAAFGWGIQLAPLDVLCEAGGPRLCEAARAERAFAYDP